MAELRTVLSVDKPAPVREPAAIIVGGVRYLTADAPDGYGGLLYRARLTVESHNREIAEGRAEGEPWSVEEEAADEPK
ncbi:MAG TPA: hypothetical protein VFH17_08525 [Coriobacteriia bacterium]|nr:hypothetical protein [Coriobacteriia bacterium]